MENKIKELEEKLLRKEKECEELKEKVEYLQKIKDLVSDDDSMACDYELAYDLAKEILQIISEVEE